MSSSRTFEQSEAGIDRTGGIGLDRALQPPEALSTLTAAECQPSGVEEAGAASESDVHHSLARLDELQRLGCQGGRVGGVDHGVPRKSMKRGIEHNPGLAVNDPGKCESYTQTFSGTRVRMTSRPTIRLSSMQAEPFP